MPEAETRRLQGYRLSVAVEQIDAWAFAADHEGDPPLRARVLADGANYLAGPEAPEPLKQALLLEFEDVVAFEGLEWRFAIATTRYVEEAFHALSLGRSLTAHLRYIPRSAVESPDPFAGTWSESTPFLIARLERIG